MLITLLKVKDRLLLVWLELEIWTDNSTILECKFASSPFFFLFFSRFSLTFLVLFLFRFSFFSYAWSGAVTLSTSVTFNGSCGDVLIFQIGGGYTLAASAEIILTGGLTASTVFFVVAGAFTTGASSMFQGIVLGSSTVTLGASSTFVGKLKHFFLFLFFVRRPGANFYNS